MSYINSRRHFSKGRGSVRSSFTAHHNKQTKELIPSSRFIKSAHLIQEADYVPKHSLQDFIVDPLIQRNLKANSLVDPTPIQDQAIPLGLKGDDVIGIADTGTGKTLAFVVPVLNRVMTHKESKVLIMAPTRELAVQIQEECFMVARGSHLRGALLIGGKPYNPQRRDLSLNPNVVIGTPGRIKDHIKAGGLRLSSFNVVVLDEVDMMLDMGFVNDVKSILSQLATVRQSLFFSATLDSRVRELINAFSHNPVTVFVKTGETTDSVEQNIVSYSSKEQKLEKLENILSDGHIRKALVFDDTQRSVERLSDMLVARGFNADAIHGGRSQNQRQRALDRFKKSEITILVATDVAARGIDVTGITHVINFSTPKTYTDYVHRIGRTGRAGRMGHALTFVQN